MTDKSKTYTLHFYHLSTYLPENLPKATAALHNFFTKHSGKNDPTPATFVVDNKIQLQNIVKLENMGCPMVSGVVKKFIDEDLPKTGVAGKASEDDIELDDDESVIFKTYFLYNFSNNVLLYQFNQQGISCNHFKKYLRTQEDTFPDIKRVLFSAIPTYEAYEMLMRGDIKLKQFNIRIPRPTATDLYSSAPTPWVNNLMNLMTDIGGNLNLTLNAGLKNRNRSLKNPEASNFLRDILRMPANGPNPIGIKGNIAVIREDDTIENIGLVMDKLSATVNISMDGRYPKHDDIIKEMAKAFNEKQDVINSIFSGNEGNE